MALNFLNNGYFAGKVGIGTESPGYKLDVVGSIKASVQGRFASGSAATPSYSFDADSDSGMFRATTNALGFSTAGTERVRIDQVGNVGIGTTNPSSRLEIKATSATHKLVSINRPSSDTAALYIGNDSASPSNGIISSNYSDLIFGRDQSGTLSEWMRIKRDGNVGIGVTGPDNKLMVQGASTTGAGSTGNVALFEGPSGTNGLKVFVDDTENAAGFQTISADDLLINPHGGNVGIGTASPDDKLHVNQGSAAFRGITIEGTSPALYLKDTQATNAYHIGSNGNYLYFLEDSNQSGGYNNIMAFWDPSNNFIFSLGNVGIGTSTPTQKLHVAGNARVTGAYYDSNNSPGTANQVLVSTVTGTDWVDGSAIPGVPAGSGTLNTVTMWTPDGDTLGNSPITISGNDITSSGRGIIENTTNLTTGVVDSLLIKNLSSGTSITNGFGTAIAFYLENTVYSAVNEVGKISIIQTDTTAIDNKMVFSVKDNNILADRLTLTGQEAVFTGNVGIGTTTPTAPLDVFGVRAGRDWSINNRATIRLDANGAGYPSDILFGHTAAANQTSWTGAYWSLSSRGSSDNNRFHFYRGSGNPAASSEAILMTLDPNLRVGINNTSPSSTLDVTGTGNFTGLVSGITPVNAANFVTKAYVDGSGGGTGPFLPLAGGTMTGTNGVLMPDNFKLKFGDATTPDLEIFHNGSNSYVRDSGTGGLVLEGSTMLELKARSGELYLRGNENSSVQLYHNNNLKLYTANTGVAVTGDINIDSALLSNQENTDVDTGTETVASVAIATYTAAFFDFVIKKTTNVRSGTVYACHDGTNVEFTETSTQDLGDTSDVTLSVDISGGNMRLRATTTSDDWSVKSLIRAI